MMKLKFYLSFFPIVFVPELVLCFNAQTQFEISSNNDVNYLFTNKYLEIFDNKFNSCIFDVENNNTKYHTCTEFKSDMACECHFLRDVKENCHGIGKKNNNYWYFKQELKEICKESEEQSIEDEQQQEESLEKRQIINHVEPFKSKSKQQEQLKQYELLEQGHKETQSFSPERKQLHSKNALSAINFSQYYNKKKPSAMTINCSLMHALKVTVTPTNKIMTKYSTKVLVPEASRTHTTNLEVIKVIDQSSLLQKRHYNSSLVANFTSTSSSRHNTSNNSYIYASNASTLKSSHIFLTIVGSISLALVIFPWIPLDKTSQLEPTRRPSKKRIRSVTDKKFLNKRMKSNFNT